jgi:transposase
VGEADTAAPALLAPPEAPSSPRRDEARAGAIEIALPDGSCVCVDAFVNEKALSRVLRAMRGAA